MAGLPEPMTPPDCDLRGYDFMPLFGHRLFNSDFDIHATDAEFRAAMRLWWAAWQQCPAASLPDDENALCRLAGLGRDLRKWRKIAARSLQGFCKCADGRLYHPILAQEAKEAYARRVSDRERKRKYRENKASAPECPAGQDADVPRDATRTERGQDAGQDADVRADRTGQDRTVRESSSLRSDDSHSPPEVLREESVSHPENSLPRATSKNSEDRPLALSPRPRTRREPDMRGFDEFWKLYPRKVGKGQAERAWPQALKATGGDENEIVWGLKVQLHKFDRREDCRFVPHPSTWLNGKRWEDGLDPEEPAPSLPLDQPRSH